jgi:hypothetical protein
LLLILTQQQAWAVLLYNTNTSKEQTMHTLQDINALLQDGELHAILDEYLKEADDPNAEWFSSEEVFAQLRADLRAA